MRASFSGRVENNQDESLTLLQFLLADVAYEIFTEEIIPQRLMDEPCAVLSADVMLPVVRLTRLPHSTGKREARRLFVLIYERQKQQGTVVFNTYVKAG